MSELWIVVPKTGILILNSRILVFLRVLSNTVVLGPWISSCLGIRIPQYTRPVANHWGKQPSTCRMPPNGYIPACTHRHQALWPQATNHSKQFYGRELWRLHKYRQGSQHVDQLSVASNVAPAIQMVLDTTSEFEQHENQWYHGSWYHWFSFFAVKLKGIKAKFMAEYFWETCFQSSHHSWTSCWSLRCSFPFAPLSTFPGSASSHSSNSTTLCVSSSQMFHGKPIERTTTKKPHPWCQV